ncbi:MAG TPA: RsmE family RNA methyltransferase [Tepidisphaeraceae bacterium]|nr:RsmE family RNA methyltransferase [Tepidisphaeraceae bacterium]
MPRRFHVPVLRPGELPLDPAQAHHARDVLRLGIGAEVELFDDAGASAAGVISYYGDGAVSVRVSSVDAPVSARGLQWSVAAAVPKGDRADWMVEKLSELGASAFIPVAAARSVVLPEGRGKRERWMRIATESAKQSRRAGVMRIDPLTQLESAIASVAALRDEGARGWVCTTEIPGVSAADAVDSARGSESLTLFIGPEGGWSGDELDAFGAGAILPVRLGENILRIETAAIAAAAIVAALFLPAAPKKR